MSLNYARSPRELAIAVIDVCRDEHWPLVTVISHLGIEGRRIMAALEADSEEHPSEYTVDELNWITSNAFEVQSIHA